MGYPTRGNPFLENIPHKDETHAMLITSIKPLSRDPSRLVVRGEGGWKTTLPAETVHRLGLAVGRVCDPRLKQGMHAAGQQDTILRQALRVIRRRAIGSRQLLDRLTRKGHDPQAVQPVIAELLDKGILNDETYARSAAATLRAAKPAGSRLLRQKLYQKRLPRDVIERVVADVEREADPLAEALALAQKKLRAPTLQRCDALTRKRRLHGLLARRGFNADVIQQVLRQLEGAEREG